MTDVDALAEWFPGVDRKILDRIVEVLPDALPADVATVLDALADRDMVVPGDYEGLLERQRVDGWASAACGDCGKVFTGETQEAAQRKVNGHLASHRVQGSSEAAAAAAGDTDGPASVSAAEKSLEARTDREAGEYPTPEEAMAELQEGAEAETETEADGGE